MSKFLTMPALATILFTCAPAVNADFSANVGFVTDYLYRGISQTDNSPAIQGGFDYSHDSGVYLGIWGSNVDFDDSLEIDLYGGIAGETTGGLGWDVGLIYYRYPGQTGNGGLDGRGDSNFYEVAGSLSYDFGPAAVTGSINYSPDFFAESDDAVYVTLGVDVPLPQEFGLSFHVGHQTIDDEDQFWGMTGAESSYTDWSVGVSKTYQGFDFALTYADTDVSKRKCFGGDNLCDGTVVFSVARSF